MKKLVNIFAAMLLFILAACSSNNPKAIAEKYLYSLSDGDFETVAELLYYSSDTPEEIEAEKTRIINMLKQLAPKEDKKIKSLTIEDEVLDEDGTKVLVTYKAILKDGSEDKNGVMLVKDDEGNWKVRAKK